MNRGEGTGPPLQPGGAAAVEFRHVTKRFGAGDGPGAAVNDLSFEVPPGEICVLVGPSGCGKTTTLKMVNRLIEPTSGEVLLDGQDVMRADAVALRRRIGYVIQQIGLFPHETIAENVATVPRLLQWPRDRITRRVDELLVLVGLDPDRKRRRYPSQLSGGERQRVGVARALAAEPPVLLMDEPFGAVDPIVRERLQDEFLRIQRQLRTTVLFVTHDIDEAIKVGDRVAVFMEGGRLAQYSPPAELLASPASDYVARFVGSDRALKRLALMTVGELDVEAQPLAIPGGWPRLGRDSNVRDALAELLSSPEERVAVVDDQGAVLGVLTLEAVARALRSSLRSTAQGGGAEGANEPVQPEPIEG
jgi:osmoprotectant transport system ATP-binding protein